VFAKGQRIELEITDLAEGTKCFGKVDSLAVFVHGTAAVGDRVAAAVSKVKRNYLEARLLEVLVPSPTRVEPRCGHFGTCGGCKWQHVAYDEQLRVKRKLVADALERIGGFSGVDVAAPLAAPSVFAYRNKVEFSFSDRRYLAESELAAPRGPSDFALGFHAPQNYAKAIDIERCHIATDEMNQALTRTRAFALASGQRPYSTKTHEGFYRHLMVRHAAKTGQLMVNLVTSWHEPALMGDYVQALREALGERITTIVNNTTTSKGNTAFGEKEHVLFGPGHIVEQLGSLRFRISANSFFQTNTLQAERLYETALAMAGLTGAETVFDLFCGTGTITLFAAPQCRSITGFEVDAGSVADARRNAEDNGVKNASFVQLDLKDFRRWQAPEPPDVVITDPPRAGMHPDAVEALRGMAPRRLVYVSCNPASLARDANALCQGGLFRLGTVQPVDLFPHTYHVESVALLERV
jgi:23S rRNA (uracil1939-C5)-methyltransferase